MGARFRPRRPLLRLATGAATAGIAYQVGKRRAQQDVYNQQATAAYDATTLQPEPGAPASAAEDQTIPELARLGQLHDAGTLTDEEFTAAKAKLLGL